MTREPQLRNALFRGIVILLYSTSSVRRGVTRHQCRVADRCDQEKCEKIV